VRPTSMWLGLGCLLSLLLIVSCSTTLAELPPSVTIFYSNEAENELYKCCSTNQAGGLSRRATVIASHDWETSLVVDTGNFSAKRPGNTYDEFKLTYLLRGYELMGYSALNVGPLEFNRGEALLRSLGQQTGNRLISANVVDASGKLVLAPYKVVEVEGLNVGIVGLITDQSGAHLPGSHTPPDPLKTIEPVAALGELWEALEKASDIQILLSQLTDDENSAVIQAFPNLDVILGGPGWRQNAQMEPWEEQGVVIGKVGVRGKFQGQMTLSIERDKKKEITIGRYSGEATFLGGSIPDNPAMESLLEEYAQRVRSGEVLQDHYESHTDHQ